VWIIHTWYNVIHGFSTTHHDLHLREHNLPHSFMPCSTFTSPPTSTIPQSSVLGQWGQLLPSPAVRPHATPPRSTPPPPRRDNAPPASGEETNRIGDEGLLRRRTWTWRSLGDPQSVGLHREFVEFSTNVVPFPTSAESLPPCGVPCMR
jgi:hypothetical protein